MKKALIYENKIIQVENNSFEVSEPLIWIDCPETCNTNWSYNGIEFFPPAEKSLEEIKKNKKELNSSYRYAKETSGIDYNGHFILTEREDINILNATMEKIRRGLVPAISWKCGDGSYIDLTNDNILDIEIAVLTHIQSCFATEKVYNDAIDIASTIEELNNIELVY